jgi:alanine-glyoxylate transaminase/(R)-3-amino-2-methylpropionate-pyruvate transaminase
MEGLNGLMEKHSIIGDVRGRGLMVGLEMVTDRDTKDPASAECAQVFERCKDLGLILGKGGLYGSILRIKPPMCLNADDIDFMVQVMDQAFSEL